MRGIGNLVLLLAVLVAAVLLFFYVCPYFAMIGHKWLCYAGYAILILVLLWARSSASRQQRARRD